MLRPAAHRRGARPRREILPSGLTLVTERMRNLRSATIGIWLTRGSRHEPEAASGISHFVEHLVFKGTTTRSCREIARIIDRTGGMTDASTSKEFATFSVKVMDEHLPIALDLLTDILTKPAFDPAEMENERKVIYEEIRSTFDDPEDYLGETYYQSYYGRHPLGRSILGTADSVAAIDRDAIVEFFRANYLPQNLVVSAAGQIEHELLAQFFNQVFPARGQGGGESNGGGRPVPRPERLYVGRKELEHMHVKLGFPGLPRTHEERYALMVLNGILGSGMSSRLFQNIRERWGLCYAIYSYITNYRDVGTTTIYTAVAPKEVERAIRLILEEVAALCRGDIDEHELDDVKSHLKGSLMLSIEGPGSRMGSLAVHEIYFNRIFDPEEVLRRVSAVRLDQVVDMARRIFLTDPPALIVLGGAPTFNVNSIDLHIT